MLGCLKYCTFNIRRFGPSLKLNNDFACSFETLFFYCGFSQKEGIDYEETFTPVARYTSIRTIIALATKMKWKLHQMDVKTTFLNGVIEEEVYIEQPQGFEVEDRKSHVCRLKQAPRAWYGCIDNFLMSLGVFGEKHPTD